MFGSAFDCTTLTSGLLRRAREMLWALIGYALLAQRAGGDRPASFP